MSHEDGDLRRLIDTTSMALVATTPEPALLLIETPTPGHRDPACTIPCFVDLRWSTRTLLQQIWLQTEHAHRVGDCVCRVRPAARSIVVDAATGRALLPLTVQSIARVDERLALGRRVRLPSTIDGARSPPNGDPILDVAVSALVDQRYLTPLRLGSTISYDAVKKTARHSLHAPPLCAHRLRQLVGSSPRHTPTCDATDNEAPTADCACTTCGLARLHTIASVRLQFKCFRGSARCLCLFLPLLGRTSIVLRLAVVALPEDRTDLFACSRLAPLDSAGVLYDQARVLLARRVTDLPISDPTAFRLYDLLLLAGAFDRPPRGSTPAAVGFQAPDDRGRRLDEWALLGSRLSEATERVIVGRLARGESALARLPLSTPARAADDSYTLGAHDRATAGVLFLLYYAAAIDAVREAATDDPLYRFEMLVVERMRGRVG